jgi:hypothetical protein
MMADPAELLPADNPATIAHLNQLQAIISRLAGNSAQCKTWCVAIVSALLSFAAASKNDKFVTIAIIPVVIFCLIDAAYLGREKAFRELYNSIVNQIRNRSYTRADCFNLIPAAGTGYFFSALFSWSVLPIYLGLIAVYFLARVIGLLP